MSTASPFRQTAYAVASLAAAFVGALVVVSGATKWLPHGAAGIDHIVLPILVFPVVWVVFALTLYAARRRGRSWAIVGGVTALHLALIVWGFLA